VVLLAFDTATPTVTVALHDGTDVVVELDSDQPMRHAEQLAPLVDRALTGAGIVRQDLTAIAVGVGPGPFTGLRVGLVTARMTASALGLPLHGVSTLDALAAQALEDGVLPLGSEFLVATDARRREVYWAAYRSDGADLAVRRTDGPHVARPADVPRDGRPVVGRGAELYAAELGPALAPLDPSAAALARLVVRRLAAGEDLSDVEPRYLRRPDVHESAGRKSVLG
jgi:tRNA threonylcarbamoyladenosine biosynthesis protein TsaB